MKRDLEKVLQILEVIEARRAGDYTPPKPCELGDMPQAEVDEYVRLLQEAGYIDAHFFRFDVSGGAGPTATVAGGSTRLTWSGHEFLAAIRNPEVRDEANRRAGGKLMGLPFEVIKALTIEAAKHLLFGPH